MEVNMKNIEDIEMQKIIQFAEKFYATLDFAHNIEHGKRVVKLAKKIMIEEGGNPSLVEAGAYLHQFHDNLEVVKHFIQTLNIDNQLKNDLYKIVVECRPQKINNTSSIESKIVFDADSLEVLCPYGMIRELFCNIKARNKDWNTSVKDTINVQNQFKSKLMTSTAKRMIDDDFEIIQKFWNTYSKWENI